MGFRPRKLPRLHHGEQLPTQVHRTELLQGTAGCCEHYRRTSIEHESTAAEHARALRGHDQRLQQARRSVATVPGQKGRRGCLGGGQMHSMHKTHCLFCPSNGERGQYSRFPFARPRLAKAGALTRHAQRKKNTHNAWTALDHEMASDDWVPCLAFTIVPRESAPSYTAIGFFFFFQRFGMGVHLQSSSRQSLSL